MTKASRSKIFGGDLFTYLARNYKIVDPSIRNYSEIFKIRSDFIDEIGDSISALSYAYRQAFRKQIFSLLPMILNKDNICLYVNIFSRRTYTGHNSFKFFLICSLISELYLFRYFHNLYSDGEQEYIQPATICFRAAFEMFLKKHFHDLYGWPHLRTSGKCDLYRAYRILKPFIDVEDPFKPKTFLDTFSAICSEPKMSGQTNATSIKIQEEGTSEFKVSQNIELKSRSSLSISSPQLYTPCSKQPTIVAKTEDIGESNSNKSNAESVTKNLSQSASLQRDACNALHSLNKESERDILNSSKTKGTAVQISESGAIDRSKKGDAEEAMFVAKKVSLDEMKKDLIGKGVEFVSFGSVDEIKNLISQVPDAQAVVFDEKCFDGRKEVKLAEALLLADKNILVADSSATKESSKITEKLVTDQLSNTGTSLDQSKAIDLDTASKEKTTSNIAANKAAMTKPWQPKKKTKKTKNSKKR